LYKRNCYQREEKLNILLVCFNKREKRTPQRKREMKTEETSTGWKTHLGGKVGKENWSKSILPPQTKKKKSQRLKKGD